MQRLQELITNCPWMVNVLATVRDVALPDAWVGAGVLRDLVWGELYGSGFDPGQVRDVDVAFFDPDQLGSDTDDLATARLNDRCPAVPWEATNQASVHLWYPALYGGEPVPALTSTADAIGTWPETATSVAVRLNPGGELQVCAPLGLDDLLSGTWRRNPRRITPAASRARLNRHQPNRRWPSTRVVAPDGD